ncbi:MAG: TRAP transporter small permease subunit [Chloroflexi bacterium]|nr:TRAP transporter small permease subunit [Chloroflexota bacterium]
MKRIAQIIGDISGQISAWLIFTLMALLLAEVISRYVFNRAFGIADEIAAYMLPGIIFIGLAYTWKVGGHIRIEAVTSRLATNIRNRLRLVTLFIITAFVPVLILGSWELWLRLHKRGTRSASWLRTPEEWPSLAVLIGTVLLFVVVVIDIVKTVSVFRHTREKD